MSFTTNYETTMYLNTREIFLVAVSTACEALIACVNQLNIIHGECGNGDYGTIIAQGAKAIQDAIQNHMVNKNCLYSVLKQFSNIIRETVGEHEAGLYSVFLDAAADSFKECIGDQQITANVLLNGLIAGNKALSKDRRISKCERSMLDALIPAEHKLADELKKKSNPIVAFGAVVKAAEESAMQTICVKSSNIIYKYPDPGAHAVGIWLRGAYEATKLRATFLAEGQ